MSHLLSLATLPVLLVLPSTGFGAQAQEPGNEAQRGTAVSSVHKVLYDRDQAKLALAKAIGERRTGRIVFQMHASGSEGRISADCDVKAARGKHTRVEVVPRPSAVACRFASQGRRLPAQLAFNGHGGKPAEGMARVGEFKYRDLTIKIKEQQGTTGLPAKNAAATYLFEIDGEPAGSVELAESPKVHMLEVRDKVSRKAMMMAASAMAVLAGPREAHLARLSE